MLAGIMKDPTDDQKMVIDAMQALIEEAKNIEEETQSDEITKASDGLTQMVATVLLAQALPDLLKSEDVSMIKGVFAELDTE